MEQYFIGWGGLALINAALANADGRSPLKYFLGSLFFGPFVTMILGATREADDGRLGKSISGRVGQSGDEPSNNRLKLPITSLACARAAPAA